MSKYVWMAVILVTAGCGSPPKLDIGEQAARASGIADAIAIQAGDEQIGDRLTSATAVRMALHHDPRIASAIAHVRAAEADDQQARLLPNPILNIDVRFPETGGQEIFEATLTGDLIALLQKPGRIKAADQRLRAASADAITVVLDVIAQVQETYITVQSIESELEILKQRLQFSKQLRDLADSRLKAGEGTRLDVLTFDTQRLQVELDISDKQLERSEQRLILARLIGQPRDAANWSLDPWENRPISNVAESAWIDAALTHRPEIQSHAWELAALGEEVDLSSLAFLEGGDIGAHGEHDQTWAIGPTFTTPLPIFDFGQAARAKAIAMKMAAHHDLQQQRLEVIEDIRRSYARHDASRGALKMVQEQLLPFQQQQRDLAESAYKTGDSDLATLLLAESGLQEAHSKLIELQQRSAIALIQLNRAAGGAGIAAELKSTEVSPTTNNAGATP